MNIENESRFDHVWSLEHLEGKKLEDFWMSFEHTITSGSLIKWEMRLRRKA